MLKNIIVLICISLCCISCDYCTEFKYYSRKYFLDKEFSGRIDTVYSDYEDRNSPKMIVKYNRYDILGYDFEKFEIGDSIVKEKGTLKLIVYKKDVPEPIVFLPKCKGFEFE